MQAKKARSLKNAISNAIDSVFGVGREAVRKITGFRKTTATTNRRNRRRTGRLTRNPRFPAENPTRKTKRYFKTQKGYRYETRVIDLFTTINIDSAGNLFFQDANKYWTFPDITQAAEFQHMSKDWFKYKVHSIKFTFKPVSAAGSVTWGDEMLSTTSPLNWPTIRLQTYNANHTELMTYMNLNPVTMILNPSSPQIKYLTQKFNNKDMFPTANDPAYEWVATNSPYFVNNENPKWFLSTTLNPEQFFPDNETILFYVDIQIKIIGRLLDGKDDNNLRQEEPVSKINQEMIKHIVTQKNEKIRSRSRSLEDQPRHINPRRKQIEDERIQQIQAKTEINKNNPNTQIFEEIKREHNTKDNPANNQRQDNHKMRRIQKRINMRWDKIFSPENCFTDDEEEEVLNKSSDSFKEEEF